MTLPIPSLQFIPKVYRDNPETATIALTDKIDTHLAAWKKEIIELGWLTSAVKCPVQFLDELGYLFAADLQNTDSETTKRKKIFYSIKNLRNRSTWENSVKLILDAITGYSAALYSTVSPNLWVEVDGVINTGQDWALEGGNATIPYGMLELGAGTEVEIWGNVYIDLHYGIHTAVLTSDQITQIVTALESDLIPAYFIIYLGYVDVSNVFNLYSGGTI